jgi:hypothetical protein
MHYATARHLDQINRSHAWSSEVAYLDRSQIIT